MPIFVFYRLSLRLSLSTQLHCSICLLYKTLLIGLLASNLCARAQIAHQPTLSDVFDDTGALIHLAQSARRIISLAPHITELVFAAGAGDKLVGVSQYSDYPPQAVAIKQIGSSSAIDWEAIVVSKPDLIIAWQSATPAHVLARLRQLGLPLYVNEPKTLDDIARTLVAIGTLTGTQAQADAAAAQFRQRLRVLRTQYADRTPVSVFYQIWDVPLMTLGGIHLVSQAIAVCGGRNVFGNVRALAPTVNVEAVLVANPQVIVTGIEGKAFTVMAAYKTDDLSKIKTGLEMWRAYPHLRAVHDQQLLTVNADQMNRHTPRILDAIEDLCRKIARAREIGMK